MLPGVGRAGWEVEEIGIPNGCLLFVGNLVVFKGFWQISLLMERLWFGPWFYGTVHDLPSFDFLTKVLLMLF